MTHSYNSRYFIFPLLHIFNIINSTWYYSGCYSKPHMCFYLICHLFLLQHLGYLISSYKSQESLAPTWVLIEYVLHNRINSEQTTNGRWSFTYEQSCGGRDCVKMLKWWQQRTLEYHTILYKGFKDIPG